MNKIEFLGEIARLDKTQGNYSSTKIEKFSKKREKLLWGVDDRFISLYEYLVNNGFTVYVFEILRKRRNVRKSVGRMMHQFAHIWVPQLNLAIRFSPVKKGDVDHRLKTFIISSQKNFFTCVVNSGDDSIKKISEAIPRIRQYQQDTPRLGVMRDIIKPKPKKKRARIIIKEKI